MYGNVTDWIAYAGLRGTVVATGALADQALQRASDYIRTRYVMRLGLEDDNANVVEATFIAAGYELTTPGFWSATYTPSQQKVLTEVKGIKWTPVATKSGSDADAALPTSPAIEGLLLTNSTSWGLPAVMVV